MRAFQNFAGPALAVTAALAWTPVASAEIFQVEREFSCKSRSCSISDLPAVANGKRLVLRKLSCELYAIKQNAVVVRAVFYVYGQNGDKFTPRHRFVAGYFFDGSVGAPLSSYTAGLSETPTLELRADYRPVIQASGDWESASGACTLVGDLTKK